jgi:hypothetical protein
MKRQSILISIGTALALTLPVIAFAQSSGCPPPGGGYFNPINACTISQAIDTVLNLAISLVIPLSALAIMIGAFFYLSAGGSPDKIKRANHTILYGIIGIVIVLSAKTIKIVVIDVASGASAASSFADFVTRVVTAFGTVFITSHGSEEKISTARRSLLWAIVGTAVALIAFGVGPLIKNTLGP